MKTSCVMVYDAIRRHRDHLYQAHNIQPDIHITITQECRVDLFSDPKVLDYLTYGAPDYPDTIGGHGFSIVKNQDRPFRIWVSARAQ